MSFSNGESIVPKQLNTLPNQSSSNLSHLNFESSLCFPKEIFYAANFDVDSFIAHYKREYTLERLKDDLNIFLKVLEMSMSDLINKDYPDFVNLSTNLVDLDKAINDLKSPLEAIKKDVDNVKDSIDHETEQIISKLNEKLMIEKRRIVIKLLMNWQRSLKVTNEMIGNNNSEDNAKKISGDHVERIAFEFCQLKNSLSICSGDNKDSLSQNTDIKKLSEMLEKIMQDLFLNCLMPKDNDYSNQFASNSNLKEPELKQQLRHVLKSYALLSKQNLAEKLFTDYIVKPYMSQFINESYLESNIRRLNGVYEKIIEFIDQNSEFLKITNEIKNSVFSNSSSNLTEQTSDQEKHLKSNEFDFIISSFWSHIVLCLDLNLNSIFSPADPDLFHENFTITFDFLNKLELKCSAFDKEFKKKLINSQSYKYFIKKWPIQVYYQIRFQEIVSKFEEDLINYSQPSSDIHENDDSEIIDQNQNIFYLNLSDILVKQMEYCWLESKCFLKCLLSQFWKLNLQLISRYCSFFIQLFQNKIQSITTTILNNDQGLQLSVNTDMSQQTRPKTPEFNSTNQDIKSLIQTGHKSSLVDDLSLSVLLLNDVQKLYSLKLPNFFDGVIAPIVRSSNAIKEISVLKEAFSLSLNNLNELEMVLIDFISKFHVEKCLSHLRNANDIPRLYRRTNRDVPKTASMYVNLTVEVIHEFKKNYGNTKKSLRQQELVDKCIQNIIDSICIKYQSIASDLLESVKKMEDSLKRLQRVKQKNKSYAGGLSNVTNNPVMSDDDKIRLQLYLDIVEFGKLLEEKFNGYKGETNYDSLHKLVEEINTNTPGNSNNLNKETINTLNSSSILVTEENETNNV